MISLATAWIEEWVGKEEPASEKITEALLKVENVNEVMAVVMERKKQIWNKEAALCNLMIN